MKSNTTKRLILNGMMIALVFLATYFTRIPIPMTNGYFNIGDTVIIVTAVILGSRSGMVVGGLGSFLADMAAGYYLFAPFTLIVKAIEGYAVGTISSRQSIGGARNILAVVIGPALMVLGYFLAEAYALKIFDANFGLGVAWTELPLNLLQGSISAVLGYILIVMLKKMNINKYI